MSYRLAFDTGLERIATGQLDRALQVLEDRSIDRHEAIHDARKCGKRLRALLRMVRAGIGDDCYRRENAAIRDGARALSAVRDAEALLETYQRLQARFRDEVDWRTLAGIRRVLLTRRGQIGKEGTLPRQIAAFAEELRAVRTRVPSWGLDGLGFDALAPGFERSYRRGRQAMKLAADAPSDEGFHEWRKRAKYHRYHLEMLRNLWPTQIKARRAEIRALGDLLGDEHDLTVLRATLEAEHRRFGESAGVLRSLAERHQKELRDQSWSLGRRLYAERPKALTRRYRRYWQIWRCEHPRSPLGEAA